VFAVGVMAQSYTWAASEPAAPASPQSAPIQIYTSADDTALPVGTLASGENATPIAETQSAGSVKWYLIKSRSGIVGWIKQRDSEQAKTVESFFKSLPLEAAATTVAIPNVSSAVAPRGAIIVPVLSTGRSTIVSVIFNQSITGNLMLDTGATHTVVSRRLAGLLSLRPVGNAAAQTVGGVIGVAVARLQSMKVGDAEVTGLPVLIHDFSRDPRFEGLLGMDFLGRFTIGLDTQKQLLVLSPR
jgi:aspartyl protease